MAGLCTSEPLIFQRPVSTIDGISIGKIKARIMYSWNGKAQIKVYLLTVKVAASPQKSSTFRLFPLPFKKSKVSSRKS